jgi:hypothetical protein
MKLEFLPDGPDNSGLIRLYDYSQSDVQALSKIASGDSGEADQHSALMPINVPR